MKTKNGTKKKLLIFTLYGDNGASSHYRILQYIDSLQEKYEVSSHSFWTNSYIDKYIKNKQKYSLCIFLCYLVGWIKRIVQLYTEAVKCDVVFFQKTCIPKFAPVGIKHLKRLGIRVVLDIDDAMYEYKGDNTDAIASLADAVLCGNNILLSHYKKFCSNCVLIPTVERTEMYREYWSDTYTEKVVGWIGSKTTIDNLDLIVESMNEIIEQHPEVTMYIISDTPLDYSKKINNCKFIKWKSDEYLRALAQITIGIMPLKDNGVNRGKCGFKLIQYLNMRKPVVASDVGINNEIVDGNGFLAHNMIEWKNALQRLLYDKDEYEKRVRNIDNSFFKKYSFQTALKNILKQLEPQNQR